MTPSAPSKRPPWPYVGAFLLGLGALWFVLSKAGDKPAPASPVAAAPSAPAPGEAPRPPDAGGPPGGASDAAGEGDPGDPGDPGLHPVDLEKLRAKLPDNRYWREGVPTKDPAVLRARVDEERRLNDLYGKVLSNTASEEEIRNYYGERRKISEDTIEFAATVLADYGDRLPEQERGLYELSIRMNKMRLRELPKQIDDAFARKKIQDRRREEWKGATD